jgi:hypothetical protein
VNENGVRHFGQKPCVRPGLPSRLRPTGDPHEGQKRFDSGTSATVITAERGSATGVDGTDVMPAPSRPALARREPGVRFVREELGSDEPIGRLASRCEFVFVLTAPVADGDAAADASTCCGAPTGAPQMLQ